VGPEFGVGITWGSSPAGMLDRISVFGRACDVGPWRQTLTSSQAGGGKTFKLPAKLSRVAFEAVGADAPPIVRVTAPDGTSFTTPADVGPAVVGNASIVRYGKTTAVAIANPAAGTWTVEPADGSPAVAAIHVAQPAPPAKPKVRVKGGRGRGRVLTWSFAGSPGRSVRFSEEGKDAAGLIVETKKARGSVAFTPADGPVGSRTIVAEVLQDGAPAGRATAGRYRAPGPAVPARPKVAVKRTASKATLAWKKVAGAAVYQVQVTLSDGRKLSQQVTKPSFAVAAAGGLKGSATVRALGPSARFGPPAKVAVKAFAKRRKG
jgi:hypothetical protein